MIGWENIELISDRPLEVMLEEFKRLKQEYPDRYRPFLLHALRRFASLISDFWHAIVLPR